MINVYNIEGEGIDFSRFIENSDRLKNHSWSIIGDSISTDDAYVNKQYWDFLRERHENLAVYIFANHGRKISDFVGVYRNIHYSDIITVFGGVNDFGGNVPIGTITDKTTDTFYGALNLLCDGLSTLYPKSLIIYITPLGNHNSPYISADITNDLGLTIYDYADAMKAVCEQFKFPVVDICSNSMLNPYVNDISSRYFVDGLHLNILGHELLSYMLENEMLSHYIPTISS